MYASILKCTTCAFEIKDEPVFVCLTCTQRMHCTKPCSGFSESRLSELNEEANNVLIMFNNCSAIGKRDLVISTSTNDLTEKKIENKISNDNNELVTSFDRYSEVITAELKEASSSVNQSDV